VAELRCCGYDIRGCPASWYSICSAYKEGKNCWEMDGVDIPCCKRRDKSRCPECNVYIKAVELEVIEKNIEDPRIVGMGSGLFPAVL
jgi:hypothetical protein